MAHKHSVYDTDTHFQIDGVTRVVKNASATKAMLVQHDHNSERFTFELPRYIDGHDMSASNAVQVHYINIDAIDETKNYSGVYEVNDLQISPGGNDVVICSWLISGNATRYVGNLSFVVRFACVSDDGTIEYAWNTAMHSKVFITEGIYNGDVIAEEYADILAQWKQELIDAGVDALTLDKTLLVEGEAADARAAGDAIRAIHENVGLMYGDILDMRKKSSEPKQIDCFSEKVWENANPLSKKVFVPLTVNSWLIMESINFKYTVSSDCDATLKLETLSGKTVATQSISLVSTATNDIVFSIGELMSPGEYKLSIETSSSVLRYNTASDYSDEYISNAGTSYFYSNSKIRFAGSVNILVPHEKEEFLTYNKVRGEKHTIAGDFTAWNGTTSTQIGANSYSVTKTSAGDGGIVSAAFEAPQSVPVRVEFEYHTDSNSEKTPVAYLSHSGNITRLITAKKGDKYVAEFDPVYYAVYEDTTSFKIIIAKAFLADETITLSDITIYQDELEGYSIYSENLMGVLSNVGKELARHEAAISSAKTDENVMVSPNGEKYVFQVSENGTPICTPIIPKKALFIGNSLLVGFGFGMAASDSEHDYYYLVNQAISEQRSNYTASKLSGGSWESCTTIADQNAFLTNTLLPHLSDDLELVIVQLGDNVNNSDKLAVFEEGATNLLRFIRTNCPKARVAWVGAWYQSTAKQEKMIYACKKTGCVFINIWDLATAENKSAVGNTYTKEDGTAHTITDAGVASHPGDLGFKAIANRMLYVLGISDTENYYT